LENRVELTKLCDRLSPEEEQLIITQAHQELGYFPEEAFCKVQASHQR